MNVVQEHLLLRFPRSLSTPPPFFLFSPSIVFELPLITCALSESCALFNNLRPPFLLLPAQDDDVLTDACWALSYLSDGPNEKIQAVIEAGVCRRLVELLMHASPAVQTPALRTVGNIVTGDDLQTQIIINFSALPCLLTLLGSPKKGIRKEACWTISNITAGNRDQIQAVIDANVVPPLVNLLANAEFDIKKEAAWAVSNATSGGTPDQIKFLVQQGCIPPLCELLGVQDYKIVNVALEGLENILKVGLADSQASGQPNFMAQVIAEVDGLTKIEGLQQHETEAIYNKAVIHFHFWTGMSAFDTFFVC